PRRADRRPPCGSPQGDRGAGQEEVGAASRAAPVRLGSPDLPAVGAASRAAPGPVRLAGPTHHCASSANGWIGRGAFGLGRDLRIASANARSSRVVIFTFDVEPVTR